MAEELVTTQRQAPDIEERGKQLLTAVYGDPTATQQTGESNEAFQLRKFGRAGVAQNIPGFQVAGLTAQQQQAMQMAGGIGGYQPYLGAAGQALGAGITGLQGAQQMYDPRSAQAFMAPYQQDVTRDALAEMDRQATMAQQGAAAGAVGAGAFGT